MCVQELLDKKYALPYRYPLLLLLRRLAAAASKLEMLRCFCYESAQLAVVRR